MWSFPAELEDALWTAAAAQLPAGALDPRALAAAIAERTRRYTSERERLRTPLAAAERARDLAARALFFTVADAAKIGVPIAELVGRGLVPAAEPLAVLDLGAGCGAMTLGLAAALPDRRLAVTAIDTDEAALAITAAAVAAAPSLAGRVSVSTRRVDASASASLPAGPFELIVAGTVLNELPGAAHAPLARALLTRLAPGGALVLIEPALRETSRALHALRDVLLAAGAAHVFAPCTRTLAPCPALADARDWCHEDRPFQPPPRLRRLIQSTGLRERGLKFSYLTLRREAAPLVARPPGTRALRVVSDALDGKGTIERMVCDDAGRVPLRLLRRDRGDSGRALAHSRRGDVLLANADEASGDPGLDLIHPADD
jgi:ribosomal protein RSM22 (predicted rRNA methylase)